MYLTYTITISSNTNITFFINNYINIRVNNKISFITYDIRLSSANYYTSILMHLNCLLDFLFSAQNISKIIF